MKTNRCHDCGAEIWITTLSAASSSSTGARSVDCPCCGARQRLDASGELASSVFPYENTGVRQNLQQLLTGSRDAAPPSNDEARVRAPLDSRRRKQRGALAASAPPKPMFRRAPQAPPSDTAATEFDGSDVLAVPAHDATGGVAELAPPPPGYGSKRETPSEVPPPEVTAEPRSQPGPLGFSVPPPRSLRPPQKPVAPRPSSKPAPLSVFELGLQAPPVPGLSERPVAITTPPASKAQRRVPWLTIVAASAAAFAGAYLATVSLGQSPEQDRAAPETSPATEPAVLARPQGETAVSSRTQAVESPAAALGANLELSQHAERTAVDRQPVPASERPALDGAAASKSTLPPAEPTAAQPQAKLAATSTEASSEQPAQRAAAVPVGAATASAPQLDEASREETALHDEAALQDEPAEPPAPPLDRVRLVQELEAVTSRAASCRAAGEPEGTARVVVTFAPSGRATSALVQAGPFAGTSTGSCIARQFRNARIPAFRGEHTTVSKAVEVR